MRASEHVARTGRACRGILMGFAFGLLRIDVSRYPRNEINEQANHPGDGPFGSGCLGRALVVLAER